jgi:hypothetical protein
MAMPPWAKGSVLVDVGGRPEREAQVPETDEDRRDPRPEPAELRRELAEVREGCLGQLLGALVGELHGVLGVSSLS